MENDSLIDPEDVNSTPAITPETLRDPNDEIPVPIAMSAAELDERAQAVDAMRNSTEELSEDELTP
jgi:hypothetical protein